MYRFHEQADGSAHHVAVTLCRLLREMKLQAGIDAEPASTVDRAWRVATFGTAVSQLCAVSTNEFIGLDYGARLALESDVIATVDGASWTSLLDLLELLKKFHAIAGITVSTRIVFEHDECVLDAALPYQNIPAPVERFAMQACLSLVCITLLRCGLTPQAMRCLDSRALQSRQPLPAGWDHIQTRTDHHCRIRFASQDLQRPGERSQTAPPSRFKNLLPTIFARSPLLVQVEHALSNSEALLDAEQLCHRLNISRATLHRALKTSGTHFQQLLEMEKLQRATYWLSVRHATIEETADHLGYSDASNFRRAFKKWAGCCPSDLRSA